MVGEGEGETGSEVAARGVEEEVSNAHGVFFLCWF